MSSIPSTLVIVAVNASILPVFVKVVSKSRLARSSSCNSVNTFGNITSNLRVLKKHSKLRLKLLFVMEF